MYKEFPIYFCDLNEKAQKALLDFVGETDPKEMNWDTELQILAPLAIFGFELDFDPIDNKTFLANKDDIQKIQDELNEHFRDCENVSAVDIDEYARELLGLKEEN